MVRGEEKMNISVVTRQKPKTREMVVAPVSQKTPVQPQQKAQRASQVPALPQKQPQLQSPLLNHLN